MQASVAPALRRGSGIAPAANLLLLLWLQVCHAGPCGPCPEEGERDCPCSNTPKQKPFQECMPLLVLLLCV
jgi:hypothetical protein